ncbi:hypothetical protein [Paratissierella segnis]|uniref:Uncharacterized protein n=1 Tax=Paratissierella segnis TaxID=2763679 RepID=A0A926ENR5_9FIRM|nr:hypothetical protein [Paratissierella segnis]MBC8586893.1 hypothetical protein [Paratissierella segnis]
MKKEFKRHLIFLVCLCFILVSLFSLIYIAEEADHDCTGEFCPICACIHIVKQTLKQLSSGIVASFAIISSLIVALAALIAALPILPCSTPINQKIRMNN